MKKRFAEAQIIGFLREAEAGVPVKGLRHVDQRGLEYISLRDDDQSDFLPVKCRRRGQDCRAIAMDSA